MITAKITQQQYEALSAKLYAEAGLQLVGRTGHLSKSGVAADYNYDGETLTIAVTRKPMLIPLSVVENRLRDALRQGGVQVA